MIGRPSGGTCTLPGKTPCDGNSARRWLTGVPARRTPRRSDAASTRYGVPKNAAKPTSSNCPACGPATTRRSPSASPAGGLPRSYFISFAGTPQCRTSPACRARPPCPPNPDGRKVLRLPITDGTASPPRSASQQRQPDSGRSKLNTSPAASTSVSFHATGAPLLRRAAKRAPVAAVFLFCGFCCWGLVFVFSCFVVVVFFFFC